MHCIIGMKRIALIQRGVSRLGLRFYGAKKKFAVNLRYKDGRQLALEHFDFYYKPIFRQQWPSIRVGLTSRSKSCAMVNNFGIKSSDYCDQFEAGGALDLIKLLEEAKNERLSERKNIGDKQRKNRNRRQIEGEAATETKPEGELGYEDSRSATAMNEFVQPTKFITRDTVPEWEEEERSPILDTWKAEDLETLPDEDIVYPKYLRVFVNPMGEIKKFEDSALDDTSSVRSHQILDAAALFPVLALDVRPNDVVLDLCASPGEKTMALIQTLVPCQLICNDVSPSRVNLLRHNMCTYIREDDEARQRIRFSRLDASHLLSDNIGIYDKVLVDVPNTEDRKSLRTQDNEGNLFCRSMMTERMRLPDQQTEILIGALKAVRRDGIVVYTTSTLSPSQNDEVVESALRRLRQDPVFGDLEFAICDLESLAYDFHRAQVLRFARRHCRYGHLVIPYLPNNYGPVYTCKLKRVG